MACVCKKGKFVVLIFTSRRKSGRGGAYLPICIAYLPICIAYLPTRILSLTRPGPGSCQLPFSPGLPPQNRPDLTSAIVLYLLHVEYSAARFVCVVFFVLRLCVFFFSSPPAVLVSINVHIRKKSERGRC
ncbi:hypothetical protein P167DRAFT_93886 [Morchella conica CCBAS932]|uniref:Uncharacterized protein n=1 Tax=Morchella conica CCBAS932 TaxID=1392247 RepID=A0A3N4KT36_9PEZI|nr:hypothetical protein P167DRAFT_93886 [Morchella conica CCBAS932]